MIVGGLASFLEYQVKEPAKGKPKYDDYGGDDYGDYGNDYGSEDEYVTEDVGNAQNAFSDINFGMNPELMMQDGFLDQNDFFPDEDEEEDRAFSNPRTENEELVLLSDLMPELVDPTGQKTRREMLAAVVSDALQSVGSQTMLMILSEEASLFNEKSREALLGLFK